jgi:diphthamide synthase (EF-2-diphthine--ammonia ligase)
MCSFNKITVMQHVFTALYVGYRSDVQLVNESLVWFKKELSHKIPVHVIEALQTECSELKKIDQKGVLYNDMLNRVEHLTDEKFASVAFMDIGGQFCTWVESLCKKNKLNGYLYLYGGKQPERTTGQTIEDAIKKWGAMESAKR